MPASKICTSSELNREPMQPSLEATANAESIRKRLKRMDEITHRTVEFQPQAGYWNNRLAPSPASKVIEPLLKKYHYIPMCKLRV